ncbi:hypothetical protein [Ottowia sp.]|uniref:hypothetical protein n=1 Tax=Ottowia sp. TaxID=1898956 RepID=UPI0025CCD4A7|nr:hypothetical protein [Ottowia sp.]MBK6616023.1 hypothetical protein [Ottowia sp.]
MDSEPTVALTRDSRIKTLRDIGEGDKISVPAVKVSIQAVLLQMAAAKMYGDSQYNQLDKHTVSLSHPDGLSVVLSGAEVGTVVAAIPYIDLGMQKAFDRYSIRTMLSIEMQQQFYCGAEENSKRRIPQHLMR